MQILKSEAHPGQLHYASIRNTRQAACLVTLGMQLEEKGICITYDAEHTRKSTGGIAHFFFRADQIENLQKLIGVYDQANADVALDEWLDAKKLNGSAELIQELEPILTQALMVWMRRAIENYCRMVGFLKEDAAKLVVTGGEPAYDDDGNLIGKQGFSVKLINGK